MPVTISHLAIVPAALILALACAHKADDCTFIRTCGNYEPDSGQGGSSLSSTGGAGTGAGGLSSIGGGGANTGGASTTATGGFVSACAPACTGAKPVCNEPTKTCVECLTNGNCPASKPACNAETNSCVGCLLDSYCSKPTPACNLATYTCVGCTEDDYCAAPTPACNSATNLCVQCTQNANCAAPTPACNTSTNLCVQCTKSDHCPSTAPLCDTPKNTCVECLSNTDCKSPLASTCVSGTCEPCSSNNDCSHLSGKGVCKTVSVGGTDAGADAGVCVQCTVDNETPCGDKSCNPATNACTTTDRGSVDICHTCVADSECIGGEVEDGGDVTARCVAMTFKGAARRGYCLQRVSAGCSNPYSVVATATSLSGAPSETYCGINQNATTCEAALDLISSKTCVADMDCGDGQGGLCKAISVVAPANRCTIPCNGSSECLAPPTAGSTCSPPTTPWCH